MGMASPSGDEAKARAEFAVLRRELEAIRAAGIPGDTLSMGMSQDWRAALAEGATMLRIGTAIFGAREAHAWAAAMSGMKVTFVGGGNMGAAIIGGLVAQGLSRRRHHRGRARRRRARVARLALRRGGARVGRGRACRPPTRSCWR